METPEEHYVEETEELAKRAKKFVEEGKKPELTKEYRERMEKFNKELRERKAPMPKSPESMGEEAMGEEAESASERKARKPKPSVSREAEAAPEEAE